MEDIFGTVSESNLQLIKLLLLIRYLEALPRTERSKLPLWGIPFAVKDNIDVQGFITTAACPQFSEREASGSAPCVQALLNAGNYNCFLMSPLSSEDIVMLYPRNSAINHKSSRMRLMRLMEVFNCFFNSCWPLISVFLSGNQKILLELDWNLLSHMLWQGASFSLHKHELLTLISCHGTILSV